MPDWVNAAYEDYAKRLPPQCRLRLREIPAGRRTKGADIGRLVQEEGARQMAAVPAGCRVIALETAGKQMNTQQLAENLESQLARGEDLALLIGGPEGLARACVDKANEVWSLSRLTLAHPLVRVVLAEQLYRAWSIINHLPYHR